ncbi:photoreceptor disk component PRCD isoform X2 [Neofelis nebulosa]|uniref:photoreceptor disk component PRCD isoform X5 n=1 Tax=Herpailurus yagouaroundi TaxID=1608482 RepID=UPI001AD63AFA|nr:photoreceptor disk component PRCD isoform X5 [Puma yagouaroundi]XP_058558988.1 photoreceptor disk component PRCD isoform X2 [Neofelis nebulosa]
MCTTLFLLSTLAMLWRRRFANRVQPEPSGLDGAVVGSNVDTDLQSSGRLAEMVTIVPKYSYR